MDLNNDELLNILKQMIVIRKFEQSTERQYKRGNIAGFLHIYSGQEAIALGAKAVLIGRPILWGLSTSGQKGVENILKIIYEEFDLAMAGCGKTKINQIDSKLVKYNFNY